MRWEPSWALTNALALFPLLAPLAGLFIVSAFGGLPALVFYVLYGGWFLVMLFAFALSYVIARWNS